MGTDIPTELLQILLDNAYDDAVEADVSLRTQLRSLEQVAFAAISSGQIVVSTSSGNAVGNRSVSFLMQIVEGWSPLALAKSYRRLININDQVVTQLEITDETTDDNRLSIKSEMMSGRLVPCKEAYNDFSMLRTGFQDAEASQ